MDAAGRATERIEITSVVIRDTPPAGPEPFSTETPDELAAYRAVIDTSLGAITVEFFPDKAPGHVRNFLRLASAGVYDDTAFHRVSRRGSSSRAATWAHAPGRWTMPSKR